MSSPAESKVCMYTFEFMDSGILCFSSTLPMSATHALEDGVLITN